MAKRVRCSGKYSNPQIIKKKEATLSEISQKKMNASPQHANDVFNKTN